MPQRRPSPATIIACIALFFAVAGGSALALQGRNSVDSGDIKKGNVKTSDIANNAVTTKKIKNNHVRAADIRANAVGSSEIGADQVGGSELTDAEAFHIVGAAGQPAFSNGGQGDCIWSALPELGPGLPLHPVGFYKDPYGVVHLSGAVRSTDGPGGDAACDGDDLADATPFTLPAGYRPVEMSIFPATGTGSPGDLLLIGGATDRTSGTTTFPAGSILAATTSGPTAFVLDGITFRATGGGSGFARQDAGAGSANPPSGALGDLLENLGG